MMEDYTTIYSYDSTHFVAFIQMTYHCSDNFHIYDFIFPFLKEIPIIKRTILFSLKFFELYNNNEIIWT